MSSGFRSLRPKSPVLAVLAALAAGAGAPSRAAAQGIPAEQLKKIKAAAVYIHVAGGAVAGTGSGFVVKVDGTTGWIVTNDHVVTLGWKVGGSRPVKPKIGVVFNSGTADEWATPAEVVAGDPERDLAVLKVTKVKRTLPEPLARHNQSRVPETTPVYVCGFPFGDSLAAGDKHPEISIGLASVSSNRSDERGILTEIQLNGALNPGNSGGPVVTAEGKVVGVAVTTIKAAGLGNAVPHHMIGEMLSGRVTEPVFVVPRGPGAGRDGVMLTKLVDPMRRVRAAQGRIAPVLPTKDKDTKTPADVSKLPGAVAVRITSKPTAPEYGESRVAFPQGVTHIWAQAEWKDAEGTTRRGAAAKIQVVGHSPTGPNPNALPPGFTAPNPNDIPAAPPPSAASPFGAPWEGGGASLPEPGDTPEMATPGVPRPPSPGGPGPRSPGRFAEALPPTPFGQVTLTDLNLDPAARLNQPVTVDVLTSGVDLAGNGDGPSLIAYLPSGAQTGRLDFVVDRATGVAVNAAGLSPPDGRRVAARVRGTVTEAPGGKPYQLVVVTEVALLGDRGTPAATFARNAPPAAPTPTTGALANGSRPTPTPAAPTTPPFTPAPPPEPAMTAAPPAPPTKASSGPGVGVVLIVLGAGVVFVVLLAGGGVALYLMAQAKKAAADGSDDDDEAEDDDRPRRPGRRPGR